MNLGVISPLIGPLFRGAQRSLCGLPRLILSTQVIFRPMQEKRTKPGEKAKHDLNEKTTYRFGNRSFIVEPVFKEETQNTLGCVLLRLMKSESAGA